jgi:hypothetical protein
MNFDLKTSFNNKQLKMKYCGNRRFSAAGIPFHFPVGSISIPGAEIQPSGFIFNYHDEYT